MFRFASSSPASSGRHRWKRAWSRSRPTPAIVGHGLDGITRETVIAEIVNRVVAPAIKGDDPLANERIWDKLYWTSLPRGQTGFGAQAISAIDTALWDIKGKALGEPVWRLLGGARDRRAALRDLRLRLPRSRGACAAAKLGSRRATVGSRWWSATRRCDGATPRPLADVIREDAARVRRCARRSGPRSSSTSTPIAASIFITPRAWPSW